MHRGAARINFLRAAVLFFLLRSSEKTWSLLTTASTRWPHSAVFATVWLRSTFFCQRVDYRFIKKKKITLNPIQRGTALSWYAWCDSNARPSESESDTLSSWATGAYGSEWKICRAKTGKRGKTGKSVKPEPGFSVERLPKWTTFILYRKSRGLSMHIFFFCKKV